jgi:hypothetical protein
MGAAPDPDAVGLRGGRGPRQQADARGERDAPPPGARRLHAMKRLRIRACTGRCVRYTGTNGRSRA